MALCASLDKKTFLETYLLLCLMFIKKKTADDIEKISNTRAFTKILKIAETFISRLFERMIQKK